MQKMETDNDEWRLIFRFFVNVALTISCLLFFYLFFLMQNGVSFYYLVCERKQGGEDEPCRSFPFGRGINLTVLLLPRWCLG
jgi:hypothetical protein